MGKTAVGATALGAGPIPQLLMNKDVRSQLGKTLMGGNEQKENINLLSPEQQGFLGSALGPQQQQLASGAYSDMLQPYNQEGFGDLFQKSFIDPSMQALQQQIIPGLKESFLGTDESGSGSLNRALSQSASDVATGLGSQYMNFYNQQQQNKLGALSGLGGLAGQRTFEPNIEQTQGILGPLISALGQIAAGYVSGGATAIPGLIKSATDAAAPRSAIAPGAATGPYDKYGTGNTYNPYTGVQGPSGRAY